MSATCDFNVQQEIVAYWKFCQDRGFQPSIRACVDHLRRFKVKIHERTAAAALVEFLARSPHPKSTRLKRVPCKNRAEICSTPEAQPQHAGGTPDEGLQHIAITPEADRQHYTRAAKVSLSKDSFETPNGVSSAAHTEDFPEHEPRPATATSVPQTDGALAIAPPPPTLRAVPTQAALLPEMRPAAKAKPKPKPIDTAWIEPMRAATRRLAHLRLIELELDERVELARFHAWKFEHYRDEAKANARAAELVGALAELGRTRSHGGFTVGEYVEGLTELMKSTRTLIHSPWAFRGTIEYGPRDPTSDAREALARAR